MRGEVRAILLLFNAGHLDGLRALVRSFSQP